MFEKPLLQNFLEKSLSHKGKLRAVLEACQALIKGNRLTIAALGRNIANGNTSKSNINKMWRLISSASLHQDREEVFRELNKELLKENKQPIISVDWTDSNPASPTQILSGCISLSGRASVCYEKVFPQKLYNSQKAHQQFIHGLSQVLPKDCRPIIVTDSASSFGVGWFKLIKAQGWFWAGRIQKNFGLCGIEGDFLKVEELYKKATSKAKQFKNVLLTQTHQFLCNITIIKKLPKKKYSSKKYSTKRSHRHATTNYKNKGNQPWVIVVDPELNLNKDTAISLYATRMMIEERFRDTKDAHYGSGFLLSRSKDIQVLENLLLIDTITKFILWIAGAYAEAKGYARFFQANTIRHKRVLSLVRLGLEVLRKHDRKIIWIDLHNFDEALSIWRGHLVSLDSLSVASGQKM